MKRKDARTQRRKGGKGGKERAARQARRFRTVERQQTGTALSLWMGSWSLESSSSSVSSAVKNLCRLIDLPKGIRFHPGSTPVPDLARQRAWAGACSPRTRTKACTECVEVRSEWRAGLVRVRGAQWLDGPHALARSGTRVERVPTNLVGVAASKRWGSRTKERARRPSLVAPDLAFASDRPISPSARRWVCRG